MGRKIEYELVVDGNGWVLILGDNGRNIAWTPEGHPILFRSEDEALAWLRVRHEPTEESWQAYIDATGGSAALDDVEVTDEMVDEEFEAAHDGLVFAAYKASRRNNAFAVNMALRALRELGVEGVAAADKFRQWQQDHTADS